MTSRIFYFILKYYSASIKKIFSFFFSSEEYVIIDVSLKTDKNEETKKVNILKYHTNN